MRKRVLLSFDIEEFDVPLEYDVPIPFEQQIRISTQGTKRILDQLKEGDVKATFFSTVTFARNAPEVIRRIIDEGHELASHGWFHSEFENKHLLQSRDELARITGREIRGFRMARMMDVDHDEIRRAGYRYNSSLNPVYVPGRYNNFSKPRTMYHEDGLINLPASATPLLRIPLFWLSFHHLPSWMYRLACIRTMNHDGYLNLYFHPWEFTDLNDPQLGLPWLIRKNSGQAMSTRFERLLQWMKSRRWSFEKIEDFVQ